MPHMSIPQGSVATPVPKSLCHALGSSAKALWQPQLAWVGVKPFSGAGRQCSAHARIFSGRCSASPP